ncbi:hypothetical protein KR222_003788 [Zaprionus bogoriensis]|nr:hypothetical protein KR222_003788 [Zaprionus bogoriensis]
MRIRTTTGRRPKSPVTVNEPTSASLILRAVSSSGHGLPELEAAAALIMLRYQYDRKASTASCAESSVTPPPPPPPSAGEPAIAVASTSAAAAAQKRAANEPAVRAVPQPIKKRTIPPHLLHGATTPAPAPVDTPATTAAARVANGAISKVSVKPAVAACNKTLLKSCRNMIRNFLNNQELF